MCTLQWKWPVLGLSRTRLISGEVSEQLVNIRQLILPGIVLLTAKLTPCLQKVVGGHLGQGQLMQPNLTSIKDVSPQHLSIGLQAKFGHIPGCSNAHQEGLVVQRARLALTMHQVEAIYIHAWETQSKYLLRLIVDLKYSNPTLSPFDDVQRLNIIRLLPDTLKGGKRA